MDDDKGNHVFTPLTVLIYLALSGIIFLLCGIGFGGLLLWVISTFIQILFWVAFWENNDYINGRLGLWEAENTQYRIAEYSSERVDQNLYCVEKRVLFPFGWHFWYTVGMYRYEKSASDIKEDYYQLLKRRDQRIKKLGGYYDMRKHKTIIEEDNK